MSMSDECRSAFADWVSKKTDLDKLAQKRAKACGEHNDKESETKKAAARLCSLLLPKGDVGYFRFPGNGTIYRVRHNDYHVIDEIDVIAI